MQYDRRLADSRAVILVKVPGAEGIMIVGVGAHMPPIWPAVWISAELRCR